MANAVATESSTSIVMERIPTHSTLFLIILAVLNDVKADPSMRGAKTSTHNATSASILHYRLSKCLTYFIPNPYSGTPDRSKYDELVHATLFHVTCDARGKPRGFVKIGRVILGVGLDFSVPNSPLRLTASFCVLHSLCSTYSLCSTFNFGTVPIS